GRFFADEVATPLGIELWIGLPAEEEHRVATLELAPDWGQAGHLNPETYATDPFLASIWGNPEIFSAKSFFLERSGHPSRRDSGSQRDRHRARHRSPLRLPRRWRRTAPLGGNSPPRAHGGVGRVRRGSRGGAQVRRRLPAPNRNDVVWSTRGCL